MEDHLYRSVYGGDHTGGFGGCLRRGVGLLVGGVGEDLGGLLGSRIMDGVRFLVNSWSLDGKIIWRNLREVAPWYNYSSLLQEDVWKIEWFLVEDWPDVRFTVTAP